MSHPQRGLAAYPGRQWTWPRSLLVLVSTCRPSSVRRLSVVGKDSNRPGGTLNIRGSEEEFLGPPGAGARCRSADAGCEPICLRPLGLRRGAGWGPRSNTPPISLPLTRRRAFLHDLRKRPSTLCPTLEFRRPGSIPAPSGSRLLSTRSHRECGIPGQQDHERGLTRRSNADAVRNTAAVRFSTSPSTAWSSSKVIATAAAGCPV
jgi:hypothetical protein